MFRGLLLAPPGAGKGTQGERLADHYGVVHLATGDLLRANVADGTVLGLEAKAHMDAGDLVPDRLVIDMVRQALGGDEHPLEGFLLDGFPRTLPQAREAFQWGVANDRTFDAVIMLEVPEDELVRRLIERGKASGRSDDTDAVIRNRLAVYDQNTAPLIDFYTERGILVRIDGTGSVDEVTERIITALGPLIPDRP